MAVTILKDGGWICYYRVLDPDGGRAKIKREYFGRGVDGQKAAEHRNSGLKLRTRRPPQPSGFAFGDLAMTYIAHQHMAENTKQVIAYKLNANILPYFGHRLVMGLRHHDLDMYVAKRRSNGVTDSTIRRELTDIQAILNWSCARRPPLIDHNPVRDYKPPRAYDAIIPPPSGTEVSMILDAAADHLKRAVILSYYLGLRPGAIELLSLTWLAVSWESKSILVTSAHKGGPEKRAVPIHPKLLPILKAWYKDDQNPHGPIVHYRNKPIHSIKSSWRHALLTAGITRRLRPYDLRHAFATAALENDANIKALSEIMGSKPETLMRTYQHVSSTLRRATVNKIPALFGNTKYYQKPKKKAASKSGPTT